MSEVLIAMVGDVLVDRDSPPEVFSEVLDILRAPDILFANLEAAYTDDPHPAPSAPVVVKPAAHNLDVYAQVGFNIMSMANNHILDVGYAAMLQTQSRLRAQGVKTCGAGSSAADARQPALFDCQGLRIAFLGYASVFPVGYEARFNTPGLAPMRAYSYLRDAAANEAAAAPQAITAPDERDLDALTKDIRAAREVADLVIVSFHWGDYSRAYDLTDHEKRTAHYCIDQGADLIVGHHHHVLRGMEWYRGKPILYGLGHFVFDLRLEWNEELLSVMAAHEQGSEVRYNIAPREGWPLLPMHEDARMTAIVYAKARKSGISEIGFLPCRLTPDGRVHALELETREASEVIAYVDRCNSTQGIRSRLEPTDTRVLAGRRAVRILET